MSKSLIIVESPAKVKTIRKFLGPEYMVEASVGHVRDLPSSSLGVDEDKGFAPHYQIIPGKEKVVSELKAAAEKADTVYLAPDPDREGEAIAWHVEELLRDKAKDIKRIQFNEITKRAVLEALKHPRDVDRDLVHAQQARRILDRLVGYKISPLLWRTVKRGISAGRVQSVALRLIVDREGEREAFVPEEYWVFRALVQGSIGEEFRLNLVKHRGKKVAIGSLAEARALEEEVQGKPFDVTKVDSKLRERQPQPPFTTSTLQQAANQRLGYGAKRTMGIAQRLYEGIEMGDGNVTALITYMRTDSVRISDEAQAAAATYIREQFGDKYLPGEERVYKAKASAQDAHEAIRPVDVSLVPDMVRPSLTAEQYNLYKLIWCRFVASQMAQAVYRDTTITAECGETQWQTKGQCQVFDGWQKVLPGEKDNLLPELEAGESLAVHAIEKEQKFTQPPARYSEASLVRTLEELGIGRPSTYATIISTLEDRGYVEKREKAFVPTELGRVVCRQLLENFAKLMDVHFTAQMEGALDKVAEGQEGWDELLSTFMDDFNPTLERADKNMKTVKGGMETELRCPDCGEPLLIRFGKAGAFLACKAYPTCKYSSNFVRDEHGHLSIAPVQQIVVGICPQCGSDLVLKRSRTGSRFIACSGYPECHYAAPFSTHVKCPKCGKGEIVEKSSKKGRIFYSCSTYPACDFSTWNEPVARECPECKSPYLVVRTTKQGTVLACPNRECGYTCSPSDEDE
ncbi:DNA topoisomerase I [Desulfovibrio sp. An276]|uniref:type I DNA topoisomerase n=1 Tax=Desulfovibrio sp. An276 TaxID=1965618 RepID=UPI000B3662D2|nr:type I DNA topoisomerase [Desulfovibrio sp. An276]OUO49710.1 DNA topoisomerase I [Desulfovibrio sp. An276]